MFYLDLPTESPGAYLAWDDALLDAAEAGGPDVLWFWESPAPFVVVGFGQQVAVECDLERCQREGVPILRRCSGGGAVVQGPGCLNFAVVLSLATDPALLSVREANTWIMERQRRALATLVPNEVVVRGHTDLAIVSHGSELKFSGNAQRRKRQSLLFHGTFLLNFDLSLAGKYLRHPSSEPGYRMGRDHAQFLTNLQIPARQVREALRAEWNAASLHPHPPKAEMLSLLDQRYSLKSWNLRR